MPKPYKAAKRASPRRGIPRTKPVSAWPYPRYAAHRGAGKLAPENTLTAMRVGHAHGYRMVEFDVKLSADGVLFLLHDDTLDRTSNGHGPAGALSWSHLANLDAGSWHSRAFAHEPFCPPRSLRGSTAELAGNTVDCSVEIVCELLSSLRVRLNMPAFVQPVGCQ